MDDLSDDEDEALLRRRKKQEEFARMRRALLEDERLGKIAENPKQKSFFASIEDRDDNDLAYLDPTEEVLVPDSQAELAVEEQPASEAQTSKKRKACDDLGDKENIPPKHPRRTAASATSRRPKSLLEVRESLSFLVENIVPDSQPEFSDDDDLEITPDMSLSRTNTNSSRDSLVVDRLQRSTTNDDEDDSGKRMAFAVGGSVGNTFKVPSLLRRATNLSTSSGSSGSTTPAQEGKGVRMGGSKKSNFHYQAREAEKRRVVEAIEKKRKDADRKKAQRAGGSLLGLLGKGSGFD